MSTEFCETITLDLEHRNLPGVTGGTWAAGAIRH